MQRNGSRTGAKGDAKVSRRGALRAGAAALCAALAAGRTGAAAAGEPAALHERLLGIFADRGAAARIGRAYLGARPQEADRERLLALLLAGGDGRALAEARSAPLHAALRARLRGDFAAGRTVWVDGVLLAQTEARLFALAALA